MWERGEGRRVQFMSKLCLKTCEQRRRVRSTSRKNIFLCSSLIVSLNNYRAQVGPEGRMLIVPGPEAANG